MNKQDYIDGAESALLHTYNRFPLVIDHGDGVYLYDTDGKEYHGFVLGLMADQADIYETRSNRESGFGRYDVMLIPRDRKRQGLPAVIMEFKVHNSRQEADLEATVQAALSQIEEKNYDAELLGRGFEKEQIRHYGFAFKGKEVLIG